jgi:alpha-L-fucosidase
MAKQKKLHGIKHRNQLRELLTNYGKIDILWFDGGATRGEVFPLEEIYKLQPGVVVTSRMHGYGDFRNCEVSFADQKPKGWWEYCTIWSKYKAWAYTNDPVYRPTNEVITELIKTRNWGGNYLLNIGPKADGEFPEPAVKGLEELAEWMQTYKEAVIQTDSLMDSESANVYATAKDCFRYLFLMPEKYGLIELKGITKPKKVILMSTFENVVHEFHDGCLVIDTAKLKRKDAIDAIKVQL